MPFDFLKPKQKQTLHKYPTDWLLGDMLVKAGVITQVQLDEGVKLAGNKHLHVGQMLIMAGYISPRDLQAAVDAQSMLRDRAIDQATATRCLKIACKTGMSFADIVRDQDQGASGHATNKLGEILLEAGLIDREQFAKSMQRSLSTGLPLGRILVLNGALSDPALTLALELQVRIRDGMATREEAVESLAQAGGTLSPVSQEDTVRLDSVLVSPPRKKGIRLGELMVLAGLLGETDVMNALELGLTQDMPIGQVLVGQGYVSPELLDSALELQRKVDEDKLTPMEAADLLSKIRASGIDVEQAIREAEEAKPEQPKPGISFEKLLILARVVTEDDIENALQQAAKSPQVLSRVLNLTGYVDEPTMQAILQSFTMMTNGFLSQDDTVIALDYCLHKSVETRVTFGEALSELGWNAMLPLQMQGAQSVDISQVRLAAMQAPAGSTPANNVSQSFSESTLGALAELESSAKTGSNNGQARAEAALERESDLGEGVSPLRELEMASVDFERRDDLMIVVETSAEELPVSAETLALFGADRSGQSAASFGLGDQEDTGELSLRSAKRESAGFLDSESLEPTLTLDEEEAQALFVDGAQSEAVGLDHTSVKDMLDQVEPTFTAEEIGLDDMLEESIAAPRAKELRELDAIDEMVLRAAAEQEEAMARGETDYESPGLGNLLDRMDPGLEESEAAQEQDSGVMIDLENAASAIEALGGDLSRAQASGGSAAEILADLEAATGASGEFSGSVSSEKAPARDANEKPAAAALLAELEAANVNAKEDDSAAAALVAELAASMTPELAAEAGPEPTIAELLASSKERLRVSQENLPVYEAPVEKAAPRSKDALTGLFGMGDDDDDDFAAPSEAEMVQAVNADATPEPVDSESQPPVNADNQRTISRKESSLSSDPVSSGEWPALDDSVSLRDLFSERLTEPVAPKDKPEEEESESSKTAKDLMEELLSRAASEEASKKEEQVKREAEDRSRREAEEAERKAAILAAKREAEEIAKREAEESERKAAIEAAKREAEAAAKREAEESAKREAEEAAKREAEEAAKREAEEAAKREAEEAAKREAEEAAKREAEEAAKREAEEAAKREAEEAAKREAEEAAKRDAEVAAKREAEVAAKREAEEAAKREAEEAAKREAEIAAKREAEVAAAKLESSKDDSGKDGGSVVKASFWAEAISQANIPVEKAPVADAAEAPVAAPTSTEVKAQSVESKKPAVTDTEAAMNEADQAKSADKAAKPSNKNSELLAAATKAAKAVEQAETGSQKEELKLTLVVSLSRLAESYYEQGDYAEAQGLYERILMLRQSQLGPRHQSLGADLTNLAGVLCIQGKFAQAEPFVKRVVSIIEATQPLDELKLADSLNTLAGILFQQGKFSECEPLLERSLKLRQSTLGEEHPHVADNLRDYAKLLKKLGRDSDAERVYAQAKAIIAKRPKQPA